MASEPIPFSPPPGFIKTDSPLAGSGRWIDGQWVRFYRGKPQKIGGYASLTSVALNGIPRGAHVWSDLTGRQYIAVGTASNLYSIDAADYAPTDITPNGFVAGAVNPTYLYGWGVGPWNGGPSWGTPRTSSNLLVNPLFWALGNFGQILLASYNNGGLYQWSPAASPSVPAALISAAPAAMNSFFTTAEDFVIALGTNSNGARNQMAFHWCGQGDCTDWNIDEQVSTQGGSPAGTRNLQQGTKLVAGTDLGSQLSLIWSDTAVYTHQYTGTSFVFNTQLAALECGLAGPFAFVSIPGMAFWASNNSFWMYANGVAPIPNQEDVKAFIFNQIPTNYQVKTIAFFNAAFQEVWFIFVPSGATEPGLYAVYSLESEQWFTGQLTRTSATALVGDDAHPILTGSDGFLYQHEVGLDAVASGGTDTAIPWSITSGLIEVANGARIFEVDGFYNDAQRQVGALSVQINAYDHVMDAAPIESSTQTVNPTDGSTDFRVAGRAMQVVISGSALGGDWRMGNPAFLGNATAARR